MQNGYGMIFRPSAQREPVALDPERFVVRVDDSEIALSPREFAVLETLVERPGRLVDRSTIVDRVWGRKDGGGEGALGVHVHALRRKFAAHRALRTCIRTVRGRGFYVEFST
jgi:DNA-binding response OmpR family regulator